MNHHTATTWIRITLASLLAAAMSIAVGASTPTGVVQAAEVAPPTAFAIDGDRTGPDDFATPYPAGVTPAPGSYPTTGIYQSDQIFDEEMASGCDLQDDPSTGDGGIKLGDGPIWLTGGPDPNGKTDLDFIDLAAEKVDRNGTIYDILYVGYQKCGGNGTWQTALYLDDGDGVAPSAGDDGDYLFIFDFNPDSDLVLFYQYRRIAGEWSLEPTNTTFIDGSAAGDYGEVALNLTGLVLVDDETGVARCSNLVVSGPAAAITGGDLQSQPKDLIGFPDFVIDNCGSLDVTKLGPPAGAGLLFGYDVTQTDGGQVHDGSLGVSGITAPAATSEPDADLAEIDATIEIGQTHSWTDVLSSNDYDLTETLPDPSAGWAIDTIVCSYQDVFAAGYPIVEVTLYEDGAPTGADFAVPPNSIGGTALAPTSCTITNDATGIVVGKITQPGDSTTEFPFTVTTPSGDVGFQLGNGDTRFVTADEGVALTITEGETTDSPSWELVDIVCENEDGSPASITGETADSVTLDVGSLDNTITCLFVNRQNGRITIDKTGLPADATQTFDFTISGGAAPVAVDDLTIPGPASAPTTVRPGTYTITELEPPTDADWPLVDIVCDNEQSQDLAARTATVVVNPGETVDCVFTNNQRGPVTIEKSAVLVDPAPVTGTIDQFDVRYTVTASSASYVAEDILVDDAFDFPAGLTVVGGPTFAGPAGSNTSWDGDTDTVLYDGSIAARDTLVWTIDVRVQLDLDAETAERDCRAAGSGAWNDVSLAVDDVVVGEDDACVSFGDPVIAVDKDVVGGVTVNADKSMSVTYEIDVTNTGDGPGSYELSDALGFPAWVTVSDVVVNGPVATNVDFDGDTDQAITTGPVGLGAGGTDTYSVTVTFTAAPTATADGVVCGTGPGDGLFNLAAITSTSGPDDDDACIDVPRGRIVVTKATLGGTGAFDFDGVTLFDGAGIESGTIVTVADDGTPSNPISAWVTPGAYGLTETAPAGWTKITEPCTDVSVANGQTVTCAYENGKQGSITVQKVADPAGTFEFTFGPDGDVRDVVSGTAGHTWSGLDAGTYSLTETVESPWQLLGAACDRVQYVNGDPIPLGWGEDITCIFSNEAFAEITVAKTTLPAVDPADLLFDVEVSTGATLQVGNGQVVGTGLLVADEYTVTEIVPAGWDLTDLSCAVSSSLADPDNGSSATYAGATATIDLQPGDTVRCDFENTRRGEIVVTKEIAAGSADGDALLETFDFDLTGDFSTDEQFTLDGNGNDTDGTTSSETFEVRPGAYAVAETVPDLWNLDVVVCTDDQDPADLTVDPGATVTCTFTNSPEPADVTIRKSVVNVASDVEWSFDFDISPVPAGGTSPKPAAGTGPTTVSIGWQDLVPGRQYTISETVPANWTQSGLVCEGLNDLDQDPTDASVTFVAQPGQSLSCSVTNTPDDPTITIVKTTVGGTGSFEFEVTPENDEDELVEETISTDADGVAKQGTTSPLLTGLTYSVDELDPGAAWAEGALDCGPFGTAAPGAAVDVTGRPGDDIVCEITNSALGNITVVKSTVGTDGTFGFEIDGEPFTITTDGGSGQEDFQNLQPGRYVVTETDPTADFDGTQLSCVSSNGDEETVDLAALTATVDLSNGETIVCTFTNTERAHVVVDKITDPSGDATLFTFTEDWTPATGGSFQLADGDAPHDSGPIPSNTTYTLVEAPATDWVVTGFDCTGGVNEVLYDVDPNDADGASAQITPAPGETILCTVTNSLRGPLTITKVADPAGVTRDGDLYTVSYDLTVGTGSTVTEDFTLTDTPAFAAGTTIRSTTVTDESANEVTLPLAGSIDPGETLVYTVTIEFTIDGALSLADRDCAGTGTATFNSATVTFDVEPGTDSDDDCVELPDPDITISKVVSDGQPVHVGEDVYTVEYTITVDNVGEGPGAYDLVDTPDFGTGATVTKVAVTGNGVSVDQDGDSPVTIITGESIDPDEAAHVYTVTVTFRVAGSMTTEARVCATGEERAGSGAYNAAEVTSQGGSAEDDDCVDIPEPDVSIIKSLDAANPLSRSVDGTWTIGYLLSVSNAAGAGPADYDLSDTFDFPDGVAVDGVEARIVGTDPVSSVLVAGFDGDGQPVVASDVRIDDGETHVYRILADLTIEVVPGIDGACGTGGGLVNTMAVSVRGDEPLTDDACDSFSTLTLRKQVVNDGGGTSVPADFTLTATGPATVSGAGTVAAAVPAGTYQLGETGVGGYDLSSLTCDNAAGQVSSAVVGDGENVTCTFVNDDEPIADLVIVKSASVATTGPDGAFEWTLVVTNDGPGVALDVEVGDLVPPSLTVGSVTSAFFDCSRSANDVTCSRPSMAVGASGTITIAVTVNGSAVDGPITNVGTVESSTPDPDLTNNSDEATVDVVVPLTPTPQPPPVTLPRTGSDSTSSLVRAALALVLLGALAVVVTRRRRDDGTVTPT